MKHSSLCRVSNNGKFLATVIFFDSIGFFKCFSERKISHRCSKHLQSRGLSFGHSNHETYVYGESVYLYRSIHIRTETYARILLIQLIRIIRACFIQIVQIFTCLDIINRIEWSPDSQYILAAQYKRAVIQVALLTTLPSEFRSFDLFSTLAFLVCRCGVSSSRPGLRASTKVPSDSPTLAGPQTAAIF